MAKRIAEMNADEVRAALKELDDKARRFEQSTYVPNGEGGILWRTSNDDPKVRRLVYASLNRTHAKYVARLAALGEKP